MHKAELNLDVDAPDKVAGVLLNAAQAYFQSHCELQSAWQDKNAGKDWSVIAHILENAANQINKKTL